MVHTRALIWRTSLTVFILISLVLNPAITLASVNQQSFDTAEPPEKGPEHYLLKDWTVNDAEAALQEATTQWQSVLRDFSYPPVKWDKSYGAALTMLELETLHRFEGDVDWSEANWRLAQYQALGTQIIPTSESFGVNRLVDVITHDLNSGLTSLETIDDWLAAHQFEATTHIDAPNLFGDRRNAVILHVATADPFMYDASREAIIAIEETSPNQFKVISIRNDWDFRNPFAYGRTETVSLVDSNENGVPEIVSQVTQDGRFACFLDLSVYEWRTWDGGDAFQDIANNIPEISSDNYDCEDAWALQNAEDHDGVGGIVQKDIQYTAGPACPDYVVNTYYSWSGATYLRTNQEIETFERAENENCNIDWARWAGGLNPQAVNLLEKALQKGKPARVNWGPATEDYLRFKLGTWYALQSEFELATATLERVRDNPANPDFNMSPELAGMFLAHYQSMGDTFTACKAVVEFAGQRYRRLIDELVASEQVAFFKTKWGFVEPQWSSFYSFDLSSICNSNQAFQASIKNLHPTSESEFISLLRQDQILPNVVKQTDLNNDGVNDWIIVADTNERSGNEVWPVMTMRGSLIALPNNLYTGSSSYYGTVAQCDLSPSETATVFQLGKDLLIFKIEPEGTGFYIGNLKGVSQSISNQPMAIAEYTHASQIAKDCGLPEMYFWDADNQQFSHLPKPQPMSNADIEPLEIAVFNKMDLTETAKSLQVILNSIRPMPLSFEQRAYLRYLQGLAYELAGNEHDAVNVYWQLWHDYPDSPYAMIIQRKLVPLEP